MCTQFTRAILRLPGENFAAGITTSAEGAPDFAAALAQHAAYARALERSGVTTDILPADPAYPDGVFVEDAAIVAPEWAIVTRPGAAAYRAYWRDTTAPRWDHSRAVASGTAITLKGIVVDDWLFGVASVSADGFLSPVEFPGPAGDFISAPSPDAAK